MIVALSHAEDNGADPKKVCVNEELSWKVSFLYKLMNIKTKWKAFFSEMFNQMQNPLGRTNISCTFIFCTFKGRGRIDKQNKFYLPMNGE